MRTESAVPPFSLAVHLSILGTAALPDDSWIELSGVQVNHSEGSRSESFTNTR